MQRRIFLHGIYPLNDWDSSFFFTGNAGFENGTDASKNFYHNKFYWFFLEWK